MADRGQLSLPVVEAVVGALLVVGVTVAFGVGVPGPGREAAQLERYAGDTAGALADTPAREGDGPLVARALASERSFDRRRDRLRTQTDRLLPATVRFRLLTPYGTLGPPRPPGATVGRALVPTGAGNVTVEVWYG
ncbi:MAG: hypothetical protein ABEH47_06080 [Haloferacaceae archaeon]